MPRGKRKRGAWDCHVWFEDGSSYRLSSLPDRAFTNADILASIETNLIPLLRAEVKQQANDAVGQTPENPT